MVTSQAKILMHTCFRIFDIYIYIYVSNMCSNLGIYSVVGL